MMAIDDNIKILNSHHCSPKDSEQAIHIEAVNLLHIAYFIRSTGVYFYISIICTVCCTRILD